MNTTMAAGASERLDAQIADALFGEPGMSKLDVANRLRELRGAGAPLLVDVGNPVSVSLAGREDAISALVADWEARPGITDAYRICAEELKAALAAHQPVGQEPVGYLFTDDPAVYAMPGSGFHAGSQPPQDAINVVPVYAAPPAQAVDLGSGVKAIAAERERQLQAEGFTHEGDQQYQRGELARAATAYVQLAAMDLRDGGRNHIAWHGPAAAWPWAPEWWKPVDARRDLVRAGALIAAQIDLIDSKAVGNG